MSRILPSVDQKLRDYQNNHAGRLPLYIIASPADADRMYGELRRADGLSAPAVSTTYQGCKIIAHEGLKEGEFQLSDELPDISG